MSPPESERLFALGYIALSTRNDDAGKYYLKTFVDSASSDSRLYRLEQTVEVVYDPQGPRRAARINSFPTGLWLLPVVFVSLGGLFAAIGWGGLIKALRR